VRALQSNKLNVSYAEVTAEYGHDSFLLDVGNYMSVMRAYLQRVAKECDEHENAK